MEVLGHGVGLRPDHFPDVEAGRARGGVDFFEAITENFLIPGGRPLAVLERVRRDFPVLLHGVSLSIGGTNPLDKGYLRALKTLADRIQPAWVSDHLCWGTSGKHYAHDLLPLPFTVEALGHLVSRVREVQDLLDRPLVLENVSSYLTFEGAELSEWEFLAEVALRTGCGILLDVNNVYVSASNHGFQAEDYLAGLPRDRVVQIHLAGHQDHGTYLFDSHDGPVVDGVWQLYRAAVARFGRVPTLIEWDDAIPDFDRLVAESKRAAQEMDAALAQVNAA